MRSTILILAMVCTVSILSAQLRIGLKAVSPTISANDAYNEFYQPEEGELYGVSYQSTSTSFGYGMGLLQDVGEHAWIMAEGIYRSKSVNYKVDMLSLSRDAQQKTDEFKEISIPVSAGLIHKNVKFGLGPIFNYKLQSSYGLTDYNGFDVKEKAWNTGFQFLIGYVIKDKIHIDLKREINFNGTAEDYNMMGKPLRLKSNPHTFSLNLGIFL